LLEEAQLFKDTRNCAATELLLACRCINLLAQFRGEKAECRSQSEINSFGHRTRLSLRYARSLDRARIYHDTD
jgi:hypothetical protein